MNVKLLLLSVFRPLCAILGTGLSSLSDSCSIKCTSDDVVSCTWQILYTAAADENYAMLLKVVTFTRDVACNLDTV